MNSDKTSLHVGAGRRSGMFKLRPYTHILDAKVLIRFNVETEFEWELQFFAFLWEYFAGLCHRRCIKMK